MRLVTILLSASVFAGCAGGGTAPAKNRPANAPKIMNIAATSTAPMYTYEIVKEYPHDGTAFTQGLQFVNDVFFESDGGYGQSSIRRVDLSTGKVLQKKKLNQEIFAEGLTVLNGKVYQITWRQGIALQWDMNLNLVKTFRYQGEGWGLTNDGTQLIMSDGTHRIQFIQPENFETVRTIHVSDETGMPLLHLNELEYVKGEIWANVWHSEAIGKPDCIARINPADGKLLGWINLGGISPDDVNRNRENVLNGIAYDEASDRIFVTGKNWTKLFEIKVKNM